MAKDKERTRFVDYEHIQEDTRLDQGEFFDTTHFPQSLKHYPFKGYGVYLIFGKVVEEFGFPSIEVEKLAKLPIKSPES